MATPTHTPPLRNPATPAARAMPAPMTATATRRTVSFGAANKSDGYRVVLYGTGGIGKSTNGQHMPAPVAYFDLENRIGKLGQRDGVQVVQNLETYQDVLDALNCDGYDGIKSIVIDSGTRFEEWTVAHTIATRKDEKGQSVKSIEDYGYGKGFGFVYENFLPFLAALDRHVKAGRHVLIICHDCTTEVPNPHGENWLRYEPRLQSPASGKASIRLKVKEWCDACLFFSYDVSVDKEGKGKGCGSRTIYPDELPHCMAKCLTVHTPFVVNEGDNIWDVIGIK